MSGGYADQNRDALDAARVTKVAVKIAWRLARGKDASDLLAERKRLLKEIATRQRTLRRD